MIIKPVKTGDGSFTIFSQEYNEHYHSLKAGALNESLYKHVFPAFEHIGKKDEVNILDICFGIGFNTLTTLYYLKKINYQGRVNIFSPEINGDLVRSLKQLPYPKELIRFLPSISAIANTNSYRENNISVEVFIGDACGYVKQFEDKFDIIYQDAFSSKKNPELWSEEFFASLYRSMGSGGILTTYSQSKVIRRVMQGVGFSIGEQKTDATLNIRSGTLGLK